MDKNEQIISDIFRLVKKNICNTAPFLYQLCMSLKFIAINAEMRSDEKEISASTLWTDGNNIYFFPQRIMMLYQERRLVELEDTLMHILLHGIMGHFQQWKGVDNQELYDFCADTEVEKLLQKLKRKHRNSSKIDERQRGERAYSCREMYVQYLYQINNGRVSVEGLKSVNKTEHRDNHQYWKQNSKNNTEQDLWRERRDSIMMSMPSNELEWLEDLCQIFDIQGRLNDRAVSVRGAEKCNDAQDIKGVDEGHYSFSRILKEILDIKEDKNEKEEIFDKTLYSYGFDVYRDVALLEPMEEEEDKKHINTIIIAIDTSVSCAGELIRTFLQETRKLFSEIRAEYEVDNIIVIQCDDEIRDEITYSTIDSYLDTGEIQIKGFGGTDFRPVFDRVKDIEKNNKIGCLLYFSDGRGIFPKKEVDFKTIFIMDEYDRNLIIPKWINSYYFKEREDELC